jgi:hypothetical protein
MKAAVHEESARQYTAGRRPFPVGAATATAGHESRA